MGAGLAASDIRSGSGAERLSLAPMPLISLLTSMMDRGQRRTMRTYTAVIEQCPDTGLYVGYVPGFPGAHSQGETLDALNRNLREVIEMLLEDGEPPLDAQFIGTRFTPRPRSG